MMRQEDAGKSDATAVSSEPSAPVEPIDGARMAATMQHRLRNLHAGLRMVLDSVEALPHGDTRLALKVALASDELARMRRLADRLGLAFGALPPPHAMTVAQIDADARTRFTRLAGPHDHQVGAVPGVHDVSLRAGTWLALTVDELLANATEASPPDDAAEAVPVWLAWSRYDGGIRAEVANLVPPTSTWCPDSVTTFVGRAGHEGLGLCIARRLIAAMGGGLRLDRVADRVCATLEVPDDQRT